MKEKEKLKKIRNCKVPTKEMESDLIDFQKEIDMLYTEVDILSKDRRRNKLDIYKRTGAILNREELVTFIKAVLDYRRKEILKN